MSTVIRANLSKKNKYYVEKHRYYELKHFCLQYPDWKKMYLNLNGIHLRKSEVRTSETNDIYDPTHDIAEKRERYRKKMELVEQTAMASSPELVYYLMKGVTEELSYNLLKTRFDIPCSKDTYYEAYRRFFWLLDQRKD